MINTIITSAWNQHTRCWEVIDRESSSHNTLTDIDLSASDLGCHIGDTHLVKIEEEDEFNNVRIVDSAEIVAH